MPCILQNKHNINADIKIVEFGNLFVFDKKKKEKEKCLTVNWGRRESEWFYLIFGDFHFQQYISYIMATSFSGGRIRSTQREPPAMGKQLVNFTTCGCESSAPFLYFTKPGANPRRIVDRRYEVLGNPTT